jgi:pimeloyl-ACP methyl ester carboxylesterase
VATFVLVHGAWHGAWCWREVRPLLEDQGHRVLTPDLPGHGDDRAPVEEMTLESYARRVQQSVEAAPEPVVLVGHSMGGVAVTQAAEYVPDRIDRLVYLTAFLPGDGQSLPDIAGSFEGGDDVTPNLVVDEQAGTAVVAEHMRSQLFYGECSEEDAEFCLARLVPESLAAIATPVHITADRAARLPRAYIECLRDGAIPIALQRMMQRSRPCDPVLQIDTDHSPFFSRPSELAAHLLTLA